jgi:hypothetical protein
VSGKPSDASSGQCPRPVPDPHVRPWQRVRAKLRVTPKGRTSHPCVPGQGKPGRVTASDSSMRSRHSRLPEPVADPDGRHEPGTWRGCRHVETQRRASSAWGHHGSGIKRTPTPGASHQWGTWKPRCGLAGRGAACPHLASQPPVRAAHCRSGTGRPKKRRPPAERHGEVITRRIGDISTSQEG